MANEAVERARTLWSNGRAWPDIALTLRREGFSQVDSIKACADVLRIPLGEAKRLIHYGDAWQDRSQQNEALHDVLIIMGELLAADLTHRDNLGENDQLLSEHLVGIVTAIRSSDLVRAKAMVDELLVSNDANRAVMFSGFLTATLAEMAEVGAENLLEALGLLVTSAVDPSDAEASTAIARAEAVLTRR